MRPIADGWRVLAGVLWDRNPGLKCPPTIVSRFGTTVDTYTLLSHFTLGTGLGQRSRLGDDAGLNPRAVNPTSACPDLAPVGGVWGSQAFQRRAYKLKATCCFGITKKKQEGKALGAGFLED